MKTTNAHGLKFAYSNYLAFLTVLEIRKEIAKKKKKKKIAKAVFGTPLV